MSFREKNLLSCDTFLKALYDRYDGAKVCYGCGCDIEQPEWHHIVPVQVGGTDIPTNIVPLCHACHTAITHMKPVSKYRTADGAKLTGRKMEIPENCDAIFEDYVRCRIPKSVAASRLGKGIHFVDMKVFKKYEDEHHIASRKNNIDILVATRGKVSPGEVVGSITYDDGRVERFRFDAEKPISGAFDITGEEMRTRQRRVG